MEETKEIPVVGAACPHDVSISLPCGECTRTGHDLGEPVVRAAVAKYLGAYTQGDEAGAMRAAAELYKVLGADVPEDPKPKGGSWAPTCAECADRGLDPLPIAYHGGTGTLLYFAPFVDEKGRHDHDRNQRSNRYKCRWGHSWSERAPHVCPNPACDWVQEVHS